MTNVLSIVLASLLFTNIAAANPAPESGGRPNIVIILADDLGYSDFGCYGGEIKTPNIDRIAKNGIRFSDFPAEAKCNPSRQTLLTGKYFIRAYNGRDATIAECLAPAGYARYIAGKWNMVKDIPGDPRQAPQRRGFDHVFGTPMGCGSYFAPIMLSRDGQPAESESMKPGFYYTDAITDNAVQYIRDTPKDTPLFLYVPYTAPHWPLHAIEEDIAKYKGKYAMGWDKLREQRFDRMKEMGLIRQCQTIDERFISSVEDGSCSSSRRGNDEEPDRVVPSVRSRPPALLDSVLCRVRIGPAIPLGFVSKQSC